MAKVTWSEAAREEKTQRSHPRVMSLTTVIPAWAMSPTLPGSKAKLPLLSHTVPESTFTYSLRLLQQRGND